MNRERGVGKRLEVESERERGRDEEKGWIREVELERWRWSR